MTVLSRRSHTIVPALACLMLSVAPLPVFAQVAYVSTDPNFQPYTETIPGTNLTFKMVPIPGGTFLMGSPESEEGREDNEGPQLKVKVDPFWMGVREVTWSEFDVYAFQYDIKAVARSIEAGEPVLRNEKAEAVARPTPPYVDMTFGYGHDNQPAICMTQHAADKYCEWLAAKTEKAYRLPTEAEWEFAARGGTITPWSFGADPEKLGDYAWYFDNADDKPRPVAVKKPNQYGLFDMHGNVYEWTTDKYTDDYFKIFTPGPDGVVINPLVKTDETVWFTSRGGSYQDDPEYTRSAVRWGADEDWSIQDPQIPKSIWWHTDAHWVGFRVVRPYRPTGEITFTLPTKAAD